MTGVFDEYADERLYEAALKLLKEGVPIELVVKAMPSLSLETLYKLKEQLNPVSA